MEYLVGGILGLAIGIFGRTSRFDTDRAFYPTALIVVASYYSLFAVMGGSLVPTLLIETGAGMVFLGIAVFGFQKSMWLVAIGIAGHGIFDFFVHPFLGENAGMPQWWPGFCGTIDVVIGGWLAILLLRRHDSIPKFQPGRSS